jgi:Zn-dependent protease
MTCPGCAAEIPDAALSCPQCRRLTHAAELEDLAHRAKEAWRVGNFTEEQALWRESIKLLPEDTVQYQTIRKRLEELAQQSAAAQPSSGSWRKKLSMGIGPTLLLILAKGKFLLLGLTKLTTLLSMAASLGVYWALYGWPLALGTVISIYIHEMGHVASMRRYGLPASAPMFIPGLGAFIRLRGVRLSPIVDSRIGLAGPIYGLGAALGALAVYYITHVRVWGVIANFGAWINLFNLIPIWQLDGSRGFHSQTKIQRGALALVALVLFALSRNEMLAGIAIVGLFRLFTRDVETKPDNTGLAQFAGLLVALTLVYMLSASAMATAATP